MALTSERVRLFRADYRRERIAPGYSGWRHLAFTTLICLAAMFVSLRLIHDAHWHDWLAIPVAWIVSNLVEYGMHRGPMHQLGFLGARLYKRHTSEHHRFFSREMMAIDDTRDFQATLFPHWMALVFTGLLGLPIALVIGLVIDHDVGLIFYAALMVYYVVFEWTHLAIHAPEHSPLGRLPGIAFARRHHGIHHDPARMRRANFNFGFPLGDWLFGTLER